MADETEQSDFAGPPAVPGRISRDAGPHAGSRLGRPARFVWWRVGLFAISAAGMIAVLAEMVADHVALGLKLLAAAIVVLAGLVLSW